MINENTVQAVVNLLDHGKAFQGAGSVIDDRPEYQILWGPFDDPDLSNLCALIVCRYDGGFDEILPFSEPLKAARAWFELTGIPAMIPPDVPHHFPLAVLPAAA